MSHREYGDWLSEFLDYAKDSETPFKMLYWSGVGAIAGALRRQVWLDRGRYILYPNFYILLVSPPGIVQKTTTIWDSLRLLKQIKGINFAPKDCTWESLVVKLDSVHEQNGNVITVDGVIEKTTSLMIALGEFDTFYDPDNRKLVAGLTDLWDCPDDFEKTTKFSDSEFIEKPCLNILSGATPAWVGKTFNTFSREGGLVGRFIFVWANAKRQFVSKPEKPNEQKRTRLLRDLEYISRMRGKMCVNADAESYLKQWYDRHNKYREEGIIDTTGFNDRRQTHILKLCMVISASRRETGEIMLEDMKEAMARLEEVEGDVKESFSILDQRVELRPFKSIEAFISKAKEGVRQRRVFAEFSRQFTHREIIGAIQSLIASGRVGINQIGNDVVLVWKDAE